MTNSREYTVLKDHSGFKKGSVRKCHPNLAVILAGSGKISPEPIEVKKRGKSPTTTAKEEKPKADVISTDSKDDLPDEVRDAIERVEEEEKAKPDKEKSKSGKAK